MIRIVKIGGAAITIKGKHETLDEVNNIFLLFYVICEKQIIIKAGYNICY